MGTNRIICRQCRYAAPHSGWPTYVCQKCGAINTELWRRESAEPECLGDGETDECDECEGN